MSAINAGGHIIKLTSQYEFIKYIQSMVSGAQEHKGCTKCT